MAATMEEEERSRRRASVDNSAARDEEERKAAGRAADVAMEEERSRRRASVDNSAARDEEERKAARVEALAAIEKERERQMAEIAVAEYATDLERQAAREEVDQQVEAERQRLIESGMVEKALASSTGALEPDTTEALLHAASKKQAAFMAADEQRRRRASVDAASRADEAERASAASAADAAMEAERKRRLAEEAKSISNEELERRAARNEADRLAEAERKRRKASMEAAEAADNDARAVAAEEANRAMEEERQRGGGTPAGRKPRPRDGTQTPAPKARAGRGTGSAKKSASAAKATPVRAGRRRTRGASAAATPAPRARGAGASGAAAGAAGGAAAATPAPRGRLGVAAGGSGAGSAKLRNRSSRQKAGGGRGRTREDLDGVRSQLLSSFGKAEGSSIFSAVDTSSPTHKHCMVEGKLAVSDQLTFSPAISPASRQLAAKAAHSSDPAVLALRKTDVLDATRRKIRKEEERELTFAPAIRERSKSLAQRRAARSKEELEARKARFNPDIGLSTDDRILRDNAFKPAIDIANNGDELISASYKRLTGKSISKLDVIARLSLNASRTTLPAKTRAAAETEFRASEQAWRVVRDKEAIYASKLADVRSELEAHGTPDDLELALHKVFQLNGLRNPRPPVRSALGEYHPPEPIENAIRELAFAQRIVAQAKSRYAHEFDAWLQRQVDDGVFVVVAASPDADEVDSLDSPRTHREPPPAAAAVSPTEAKLAALSLDSPLFARSAERQRQLDEHLHARELAEVKECTFLPAISPTSRKMARRGSSVDSGEGGVDVERERGAVFDRLFLTETSHGLARSRRPQPRPVEPADAFKAWSHNSDHGAALARAVAQRRTILAARVKELAALPDKLKSLTAASSPKGRKRASPAKAAKQALAAQIVPKAKEVQTLKMALNKIERKQQRAFEEWYREQYGMSPSAFHHRVLHRSRSRPQVRAGSGGNGRNPQGRARGAVSPSASPRAHESPSRVRTSSPTPAASSSPPARARKRYVQPTTVARAPSFVGTRGLKASSAKASRAKIDWDAELTYQPVISERSRKLAAAASRNRVDLTVKRTPEQEKRWAQLAAQVEADRMAECTFVPKVSAESLALAAKKGPREPSMLKFADPISSERTAKLRAELAAEEAQVCTHVPKITEASREMSYTRIERELAEQYGSPDKVPDGALHAAVPPTALSRYREHVKEIKADMDRECSFVPEINSVSAVLAERKHAAHARDCGSEGVYERLTRAGAEPGADREPISKDEAFRKYMSSEPGLSKRKRVLQKKRMLGSLRRQLQHDLIDSGKGLLYGVILNCVARKNSGREAVLNPDDEVLFERNRAWMQPIVDELAFLERAVELASSVLRSDFERWWEATPELVKIQLQDE
ncbi:uncharacterized protein AMSG_02277 [Thecamonas trahens ATCC 50062]|uniref:Uncharacterized protein n=1 Tax=Thecamonas trahens ATCC 50062 TaxID=461836 RepID=A0A0L0DVV0_THETB|nr:hypothetical protein AMSG_02277 [Thecamonas trahens ATCC 50062]KNC56307.1 hypothetical protein AMSG_02277 [Thecamonas trahens ATCC 50062]|eukprot:XP_013760826.1 hypothetical protein AMSG_02277 [Thecamonas trahens ATCC 50062]